MCLSTNNSSVTVWSVQQRVSRFWPSVRLLTVSTDSFSLFFETSLKVLFHFFPFWPLSRTASNVVCGGACGGIFMTTNSHSPCTDFHPLFLCSDNSCASTSTAFGNSSARLKFDLTWFNLIEPFSEENSSTLLWHFCVTPPLQLPLQLNPKCVRTTSQPSLPLRHTSFSPSCRGNVTEMSDLCRWPSDGN